VTIGAGSNDGGDDVNGGESVGLARKLLPVTWNPVWGDLLRTSELVPLLV
jgi:hypothetical protein